ncbi:hypothetical protein SAMD00019534_121960 [Acytostelium subglobosum LB1]|uniref:hypothetical protein n=1 Tax=Acytostelium subglobosum LB1 TaxID=1410327 RepID=UPI000644FDFF|nr:hypothetical protein SAMD00019534_121960 [Acytostelium subglobosum LB1]GAM29020.1 hypothetical protein SAMD00019534_121960 [Acytostelium subglobosum LB1]|eukprot:XP_012748026.1 hypothetical protein SAMD00019534_121960 [Acytostelium subglobosum LB1]
MKERRVKCLHKRCRSNKSDFSAQGYKEHRTNAKFHVCNAKYCSECKAIKAEEAGQKPAAASAAKPAPAKTGPGAAAEAIVPPEKECQQLFQQDMDFISQLLPVNGSMWECIEYLLKYPYGQQYNIRKYSSEMKVEHGIRSYDNFAQVSIQSIITKSIKLAKPDKTNTLYFKIFFDLFKYNQDPKRSPESTLVNGYCQLVYTEKDIKYPGRLHSLNDYDMFLCVACKDFKEVSKELTSFGKELNELLAGKKIISLLVDNETYKLKPVFVNDTATLAFLQGLSKLQRCCWCKCTPDQLCNHGMDFIPRDMSQVNDANLISPLASIPIQQHIPDVCELFVTLVEQFTRLTLSEILGKQSYTSTSPHLQKRINETLRHMVTDKDNDRIINGLRYNQNITMTLEAGKALLKNRTALLNLHREITKEEQRNSDLRQIWQQLSTLLNLCMSKQPAAAAGTPAITNAEWNKLSFVFADNFKRLFGPKSFTSELHVFVCHLGYYIETYTNLFLFTNFSIKRMYSSTLKQHCNPRKEILIPAMSRFVNTISNVGLQIMSKFYILLQTTDATVDLNTPAVWKSVANNYFRPDFFDPKERDPNSINTLFKITTYGSSRDKPQTTSSTSTTKSTAGRIIELDEDSSEPTPSTTTTTSTSTTSTTSTASTISSRSSLSSKRLKKMVKNANKPSKLQIISAVMTLKKLTLVLKGRKSNYTVELRSMKGDSFRYSCSCSIYAKRDMCKHVLWVFFQHSTLTTADAVMATEAISLSLLSSVHRSILKVITKPSVDVEEDDSPATSPILSPKITNPLVGLPALPIKTPTPSDSPPLKFTSTSGSLPPLAPKIISLTTPLNPLPNIQDLISSNGKPPATTKTTVPTTTTTTTTTTTSTASTAHPTTSIPSPEVIVVPPAQTTSTTTGAPAAAAAAVAAVGEHVKEVTANGNNGNGNSNSNTNNKNNTKKRKHEEIVRPVVVAKRLKEDHLFNSFSEAEVEEFDPDTKRYLVRFTDEESSNMEPQWTNEKDIIKSGGKVTTPFDLRTKIPDDALLLVRTVEMCRQRSMHKPKTGKDLPSWYRAKLVGRNHKGLRVLLLDFSPSTQIQEVTIPYGDNLILYHN